MRRAVVLLIALVALIVPDAGPARAVEEPAFRAGLHRVDVRPVLDKPVQIVASVLSSSPQFFAEVVLQVDLPPGVGVAHASDRCTVAPAHVTCRFPDLGPFEGAAADIHLTFATTGTYRISAGGADIEAAQLDTTVGPEDADLAGRSASARFVVGTQPTARVAHDFANLGPTAVGGAVVSGAVVGAEIVPGSFNFHRNLFGERQNVADEQCTVTASTFRCAPVFSAGVFEAPQPRIFFDVALPTEPATVVATATIAGRADPNHANDSSTFTIEVHEPAAEIFAQITPRSAPVPSSRPFLVAAPISNAGELDAQDVSARFQAPTGWSVAVPAGPLPTGVSCAVLAGVNGLRCTRATLPAGEEWPFAAVVTPPTGDGRGTVSLAVSSTSPELGFHPNDASMIIRHTPPRVLRIEPDGDLEDGDVVTLSGSGFVPNATIYYCKAVLTAAQPDESDCGEQFRTTPADRDGAFTVRLMVTRFLTLRDTGTVDCAQPGATCGIGAGDPFEPGGSVVAGPTSFAPRAPDDEPPEARIGGKVVDAEGDPVSGATVMAFRLRDGWVPSLQATTDAAGNYLLDGAEPGFGYAIRFAPPAGSDLAAEWYGAPGSPGEASRAEAAEVSLRAAGAVIADAQLERGGTLVGVVRDPGGEPVANAVVWAFRHEDRWVGTHAAPTGGDGSYRIDGIRAGTRLQVRFVPDVGSGLAAEWYDHRATRRNADRISVEPGQTVHADATLEAPDP